MLRAPGWLVREIYWLRERLFDNRFYGTIYLSLQQEDACCRAVYLQ